MDGFDGYGFEWKLIDKKNSLTHYNPLNPFKTIQSIKNKIHPIHPLFLNFIK